MKEIGGYFEFEQLITNEYYKDLLRINTGRHSLIYLMEKKRIKKLYIPYYLCESVYKILDKYSYEYEFYRIDADFLPVLDKKLLKNEYLYVVNFYGQLNNDKILNLKERYKNIIVDNTHAFFQEPLNGVDTIYNCRKWFGVPDGAYLFTNINLEKELEEDFSKDKMIHLLGRYEGKASDYYNYFQENDKKFKMEKVKKMSKLTQNILGAIDYEKVKKIRKENYQYLHDHLKSINRLKLNTIEIPFCYPLYLDNVEGVREYLSKNKIYIPTLWPNVLKENPKESLEYRYAKNILPIPCDQRYNLEEMLLVVKEVMKQVENKKY